MATSPRKPAPDKFAYKAGDLEFQPGSETAKRIKLEGKGVKAKLKKIKTQGKKP